jgi:hypothetical protein
VRKWSWKGAGHAEEEVSVAARFRELQKFRGDYDANRVTANVFSSSVAAAVPIKASHRFERTDFERLTQHIASRRWVAASIAVVVPKHDCSSVVCLERP